MTKLTAEELDEYIDRQFAAPVRRNPHIPHSGIVPKAIRPYVEGSIHAAITVAAGVPEALESDRFWTLVKERIAKQLDMYCPGVPSGLRRIAIDTITAAERTKLKTNLTKSV